MTAYRTKNKISGQTLVETMVAVFMLITGVTAATALAIYAYGTSNVAINQIVAVGLAREGIEVVRNMRDSNWLKLTMDNDQCYDFEKSASTGADCYKDWLGTKTGTLNCTPSNVDKTVCIDPDINGGNTGSGVFTLTDIDANPGDKIFDLQKVTGGSKVFGLNLGTGGAPPDLNSGSGKQLYVGSGQAYGNSSYYRKITITKNITPPFDKSTEGPRLVVTSQVWWTDNKKCSRVDDFIAAKSACKIELQTVLTNWKDYQP